MVIRDCASERHNNDTTNECEGGIRAHDNPHYGDSTLSGILNDGRAYAIQNPAYDTVSTAMYYEAYGSSGISAEDYGSSDEDA